jgi:hypothetical protein
MLSRDLQRCFSALGARLKVRTEPKGTLVQLALRDDAAGRYFQLVLPRLSRRLVAVLALQPRRKRLVLRLGEGGRHAFALVKMEPKMAIRALKRREARRLLATAGLSERPKAA